MRCLTIRQPYATLTAKGIKRAETRPAPPAGDMCPPGVRPLPGYRLNRGDQVLIHAAASDREFWRIWHDGHRYAYSVEASVVGALAPLELDFALDDPVPFGAVVAAARIVDAVPIIDDPTSELPDRPFAYADPDFVQFHDGPDDSSPLYLEGETDLGDWRQGRWALLWDDVVELPEPVPAKGRRGVWEPSYPEFVRIADQLEAVAAGG